MKDIMADKRDFISFTALLLIMVTGLGVAGCGACLLSWAAYLSMWMPSWLWLLGTAILFMGVAIAATGTATAIATIGADQKAAHKCLVLLVVLLAVEVAVAVQGAMHYPYWSQELRGEVRGSMMRSLDVYETNSTYKDMWDEIQLELPCCGVESYTDWPAEAFGDGTSVPDSCCLLPADGCGIGQYVNVTPEDVIDTQGCLVLLGQQWSDTYAFMSRNIIMPILVLQVILVMVVLMCYHRSGRLAGHVPLVMTVVNTNSKTVPFFYNSHNNNNNYYYI